MIYDTVCIGIENMGSVGVISEYETDKKYKIKGILQPINTKRKENNSIQYTENGEIDNTEYYFIFLDNGYNVNFENALLWLNSKYFIFKNCKPFYYNKKILYRTALVVPYYKE